MRRLRNLRWLGSLALVTLWIGESPANAQSFELSADVAFSLGGTLVEDHQFFGFGSGPGAVGLVPTGVEVDAYHRFPNGDQLYSTSQSFTLSGGATVTRADVVRFDGTMETLAFDAGAQGLGIDVNVDAVADDGSGNLLLSFDAGQSLSGIDVRDEDLVRFDGADFSLFFDGSAQSVPDTLDLDGAELRTSDGHLLLSFNVAGQIGGVFFEDEDVLDFDPGSGNWSMALDASAEDSALALADVNAVALPEPGVAGSLLVAGIALSRLAPGRRTRTA